MPALRGAITAITHCPRARAAARAARPVAIGRAQGRPPTAYYRSATSATLDAVSTSHATLLPWRFTADCPSSTNMAVRSQAHPGEKVHVVLDPGFHTVMTTIGEHFRCLEVEPGLQSFGNTGSEVEYKHCLPPSVRTLSRAHTILSAFLPAHTETSS